MEEEEKEHEASLYPDLRPLQPSAPPTYPVSPRYISRYSDPKTFRLTEISRIRHELNFELDKYKGLRRKYKRWDSILGWNNWITTGCSAGASAAAVACISAGLAFPISVPLGATSAALGAIAFMTIKTKHKIM